MDPKGSPCVVGSPKTGILRRGLGVFKESKQHQKDGRGKYHIYFYCMICIDLLFIQPYL